MNKYFRDIIDFEFLISVIVSVPILAMWHELGHLFVGKLLGFKTYFFIISALVFPSRSTPCYPNCSFEEFLVHLGGPIFSWFMIIFGFYMFLRKQNKYFLLFLALIAPFIYNFLGILIGIFINSTKLIKSDELKIAEYLNLLHILISSIFVFIGIVILLICYLKIKKEERLRLLTSSVIGVFVSFIIFWIVLNPIFRPDKDTLWKIFSDMEYKIEP